MTNERMYSKVMTQLLVMTIILVGLLVVGVVFLLRWIF